ncbi:ABC transporter substrate-binding protein [Thalassobaculum sp.]|uniref:ABC transporter substrate-binding protein n=1 Tax=Thalassobaculum sp. TaxID=2022740 RepID=UPI0032ECC41F
MPSRRLDAFRILLIALLLVAVTPAAAGSRPWNEVVEAARGQTVHFNAWGGSAQINGYIAWVGERVAERHGIRLVHVKLADTADAVARVVAEKTAGRNSGGSVDLIWINGENFAAMKRAGLLHGPWVEQAPNFRHVDVQGKPTTTVDFTVPTDGLEAPWGMAQFVFFHDTAHLATPPRTLAALADWIIQEPGRFTYPQPPDFIGTTFLKQALVGLVADRTVLAKPVDAVDAAAVSAPLWAWLDRIRPSLWQDGRTYPQSGPALQRLLADGEVSMAMAFNPAEASAAIAAGTLPDTVRTSTLDGGTLSNTHFVAIPFNAAGKEAAMVVADFLMSPEAQAHKQDPRVWGDFTVLDVAALPPADRRRFADLPLGIATLSPEQLGPALAEPHPSWSAWLEAEWERRYAAGR